MNPTWDETFLEICDVIAKRSKDTSTKVGAVIVGPDHEVRSIGYNGFPRGVDDDVTSRYERPIKYKWTEHAERNAIYNAVRIGIPLTDCTIYVSMLPCTDCSRAIIQSGITEIICSSMDKPERWYDDINVSLTMLREAKVIIRKPQTTREV